MLLLSDNDLRRPTPQKKKTGIAEGKGKKRASLGNGGNENKSKEQPKAVRIS